VRLNLFEKATLPLESDKVSWSKRLTFSLIYAPQKMCSFFRGNSSRSSWKTRQSPNKTKGRIWINRFFVAEIDLKNPSLEQLYAVRVLGVKSMRIYPNDKSQLARRIQHFSTLILSPGKSMEKGTNWRLYFDSIITICK